MLQLAVGIWECNGQHVDLTSQVRANTRAQDVLIRLAGVVEGLKKQLQVQGCCMLL